MQKLCTTALLALSLCSAAQASVISVDVDIAGGGSWLDYAGGGKVGNNSFDANGVFYTMDEAQNTVLAATVAVDGGSVAAGTSVDSHLLWFDPKISQRVQASVTFSGRILGVIITQSGLLATNDLLGLAGVTYLMPRLVGLEGADLFSINGNVLMVDWRASTPGDHIRVITATVPVPAAGGLLALGLLGLAAMRRRKRT